MILMCENCWIEQGSQKIVNAKTVVAATLIASVYNMEGCGAGGHGHNVFDDDNFGNASIQWCMRLKAEDYVNDWYPATSFEFVNMVLAYLLTLTEEERASAQAIRAGYFRAGVFVDGATIHTADFIERLNQL